MTSEFGCSIPISFITENGIKTIYPGMRYNENFDEIIEPKAIPSEQIKDNDE